MARMKLRPHRQRRRHGQRHVHVRATLTEVATALATLTGEPDPSRNRQEAKHDNTSRISGGTALPALTADPATVPIRSLTETGPGRRPGAVPGPSAFQRSRRFVRRPDLPAVSLAAANLCAGMIGLHSVEPGEDFLDGQARVDHGNRLCRELCDLVTLGAR